MGWITITTLEGKPYQGEVSNIYVEACVVTKTLGTALFAREHRRHLQAVRDPGLATGILVRFRHSKTTYWYYIVLRAVYIDISPLSPPPAPLLIKIRPPRPKNLRPPLTGYSTYKIHLINGCISFHSCQILSPSETGFIVSAHRLPNITLLTLIATL